MAIAETLLQELEQEADATRRVLERVPVVGIAAVVFPIAIAGASDGRTQSKAAKPPTVQVALQVGGVAYAANGPGECVSSADASLFQVPGTMWGVRQLEKDRDVNFTMWRLSKGGDMLTAWVTIGGKTHRVNTLQVGPASERRGSGHATFEKRGAGGVFTLDLVADTGAKITGQLTCSGFVPPEGNGL